MAEPLGVRHELLVARGRFVAAQPRDDHQVGAVLQGQRTAAVELAGAGIDVVAEGLAVQDTAAAAVDPGGVREPGVEPLLVRGGGTDRREPLRRPGPRPAGVDDQVGLQRPRLGALLAGPLPQQHAPHSRGVPEQPDDVGPLHHVDQRVGQNPTSHQPLQLRTGPGVDVRGGGHPAEPAAVLPQHQVRRHAHPRRARVPQFSQEARQQRLHGHLPALEQDMGMAALRHAGPRLGALREPVALDDGHPVGVSGERVRRQEPREAPTHDHRMPSVLTARSYGRVHRSAPLVTRTGTSLKYPVPASGLTMFRPFHRGRPGAAEGRTAYGPGFSPRPASAATRCC